MFPSSQVSQTLSRKILHPLPLLLYFVFHSLPHFLVLSCFILNASAIPCDALLLTEVENFFRSISFTSYFVLIFIVWMIRYAAMCKLERIRADYRKTSLAVSFYRSGQVRGSLLVQTPYPAPYRYLSICLFLYTFLSLLHLFLHNFSSFKRLIIYTTDIYSFTLCA